MKRLSIAMTALAVLGLMTMVSCRKPKIGNVPARTVTFTASTESNGGSKTTLDGLDVKWSTDDYISVNGNDATHKLALTEGAGTTFGSFTGTITATAPYLVGYPADATNNGMNITFTILDEQSGNDASLTDKIPMAAYTTDEDADLQFKNMVNVLKLDITGTQSLTKIEVESTESLSGDFTVGTGLTPSVINTGTTSKKITIEKDMTLSSTAQTVYVVLPVFGSAESTVTVKFTGDDGVHKVGPEKLTGSTTPNHMYNAPVAVSLVTPKPGPSKVTTNAGCSGSIYIYPMGGTVKLGAAQEVEYGFVCSETASVPTIEDTEHCFKVVGGIENMPVGTTSFTVDLTGLTVGTTYNVRAYAIGESGTVVYAPATSAGIKRIVVGDTPKDVNWNGGGTPGASPKEFTVASGRTVRFSQGNLQYVGSSATPYWKFADHQFDFLGITTGQGSETVTVDRDLFGWGTSGWEDNGNYFYQPYHTSNDSWPPYTSDVGYGYGPTNGSSYEFSLTGDYANSDWGVYNAISNGGNAAGMWRTLTSAEWYYLFNTRTDASSKWGHGKVGYCTQGMIILPDDWSLPTGLSFTPGNSDWSNEYSYSEWSRMEAAGAVFLPAARYRDGTGVSYLIIKGYYWSSSYNSNDTRYANNLYFESVKVQPQYAGGRFFGYSVRLVR